MKRKEHYKCYGYVFATLREATALSQLVFSETKVMYEVAATEEEVTHVFEFKEEL